MCALYVIHVHIYIYMCVFLFGCLSIYLCGIQERIHVYTTNAHIYIYMYRRWKMYPRVRHTHASGTACLGGPRPEPRGCLKSHLAAQSEESLRRGIWTASHCCRKEELLYHRDTTCRHLHAVCIYKYLVHNTPTHANTPSHTTALHLHIYTCISTPACAPTGTHTPHARRRARTPGHKYNYAFTFTYTQL